MKRHKRHKVKREIPESSCSHSRGQEEHDLAYYIHDRVELMHQVFSIIKYKELKAMAPACIRDISIDDLQELCTEELLGISSKRLCAILDGAEPPSDTESSSPSLPEQLETISLDSISSDEELLSQEDKSKKKKHRHRRHRPREGKREERESQASRAGLTVLELLELQARARAIRAQLQQEHIKTVQENIVAEPTHSSEDEVEIKEEPAEVVEISSDEEKPSIEKLELCKPMSPEKQVKSKTVTKHVNDLIITVPKQKTQKIKLNRTKSVQQTTNITATNDKQIEKTDTAQLNVDSIKEKPKDVPKNNLSKKDKTKKKKKKRMSNASDNDEITLQLSDTEKMDLLEDLDRKSYEKVSSDSSSDSDSDADANKNPTQKQSVPNLNSNKDEILSPNEGISKDENELHTNTAASKIVIIENKIINPGFDHKKMNVTDSESVVNINEIVDAQLRTLPVVENDTSDIQRNEIDANSNVEEVSQDELINNTGKDEEASIKHVNSISNQNNIEPLPAPDLTKSDSDKKYMSEGELSDRESSEVEACDLKPEVVCISDEEVGKTRKKKKKKEKKSKKEKRVKKKDNCEANQSSSQSTVNVANVTDTLKENFVTDSEITLEDTQNKVTDKQCLASETNLDTLEKPNCSTLEDDKNKLNITQTNAKHIQSNIGDESPTQIVEISDEVYELSDDSCNEYEGETSNVLSQEPTASEIEALSAKIDEIEKKEITEGGLIEESVQSIEEVVSWKDRYLDSKKVKRVLNTSNILNALRKKNRQIKKSLEESKVKSQEEPQVEEETRDVEKEMQLVEGSIEQYNTLVGSTKFVCPAKETPVDDTLKKDAKQLLKMYKKLLKYNDMNRRSDPSKKKKKQKKSKRTKESKEDKS